MAWKLVQGFIPEKATLLQKGELTIENQTKTEFWNKVMIKRL